MPVQKVVQNVPGKENIFTGTGDIIINPAPPPVIPRQLPPLDACFLGRDEELAALLEQLQPGKVAAVCGPGGMGKSALAAQAVSRLEADRFPDGTVYHRFYDEPRTDQALQTICTAFQVEAKAGLESTVRQVLAGRKALLILDGAEEADDLKAVLALRSTCGVLITSRKRADAQGFRLDLKPLEEKPAAAVFCEHSGAATDDGSVAGICKILDGWPVGLRIAGRYCSSTVESAADYLRWLEQEPFKELGDGEHQEENAALLLRRSVAQVSDDARLALSVAGTLAFAPIAREPVAVILEGDERRVRKALGELVNYGLLETKEERWQVSHALVHTYARTELGLSKEKLKRLAFCYIVFCRAASEFGKNGYASLDEERTHCLRLLESCLERKLWREINNLAGTLSTYLERQGHWVDDIAANNMMLTAARQAGKPLHEGWCLNSLGVIYWNYGDDEKALACYEQSLLIRRELDDKEGISTTLCNIGNIYSKRGEYQKAIDYLKQSLTIQQETGNRRGEGMTLLGLGFLYDSQGDYKTGLTYLKKSLLISRDIGDKSLEGAILNNIAEIYRTHDYLTKALKYNKQALAIWREQGDRPREAITCWNIGLTYKNMGDLAKAEEHISQAVQIAEQIGHPKVEEWREGLAQVRAALQSTQET